MNFREIWGEITDFCSENYIWVILMAVILAIVLIAAILHGRRNAGTEMRNAAAGQKKDDWMEDFEQRMAAFEQREGRAWEKATQLDISDEPEPQEKNCGEILTAEDNMPEADVSAGYAKINENGGMDVKVKVKVTGIRVIYDPGKAQGTETGEAFESERKTADIADAAAIPQETPTAENGTGGSRTLNHPNPEPEKTAAGMTTQVARENEESDPEIVIHKINIVKKEEIDDNVSVSRSGRMYSEEQLRQQIRK